MIETFRGSTGHRYNIQIGTTQLVLVEGPNPRAPETELIGKSDKGHRVIFTSMPLLDRYGQDETKRTPRIGDFVEVKILKSTTASLIGEACAIAKLSSFYKVAE